MRRTSCPPSSFRPTGCRPHSVDRISTLPFVLEDCARRFRGTFASVAASLPRRVTCHRRLTAAMIRTSKGRITARAQLPRGVRRRVLSQSRCSRKTLSSGGLGRRKPRVEKRAGRALRVRAHPLQRVTGPMAATHGRAGFSSAVHGKPGAIAPGVTRSDRDRRATGRRQNFAVEPMRAQRRRCGAAGRAVANRGGHGSGRTTISRSAAQAADPAAPGHRRDEIQPDSYPDRHPHDLPLASRTGVAQNQALTNSQTSREVRSRRRQGERGAAAQQPLDGEQADERH